ncbi:hypothetical protein MKW92_053486 [Papaver armeniacum]|nr:hypothetical protein MKW92_053486 [Papaver armeniacum]
MGIVSSRAEIKKKLNNVAKLMNACSKQMQGAPDNELDGQLKSCCVAGQLNMTTMILMLIFLERRQEEKKAAEEPGKSSILLDVNPWDDETDTSKLEETVRSVQMEGLTWGMSKLVAVGYGIKKLQIMMTIVDDMVSIDFIIGFWLSGL